MSKLTPADIEAAISEQEDWYWDEIEYYTRGDDALTLSIDGTEYPVKVEDEYTGGEGDWNTETFIIFKVGSQHFKKTGFYQSHYGNDWDGPLVEVHQVVRPVSVWEKV